MRLLHEKIIIYFIQVAPSGPVKIGITKNSSTLKNRFIGIQTNNHEKLILIRNINSTVSGELWLHNKFRNKYIRNEWFEFDEEMLTIIPPKFEEMKPQDLTRVKTKENQYLDKIFTEFQNIKYHGR